MLSGRYARDVWMRVNHVRIGDSIIVVTNLVQEESHSQVWLSGLFSTSIMHDRSLVILDLDDENLVVDSPFGSLNIPFYICLKYSSPLVKAKVYSQEIQSYIESQRISQWHPTLSLLTNKLKKFGVK